MNPSRITSAGWSNAEKYPRSTSTSCPMSFPSRTAPSRDPKAEEGRPAGIGTQDFQHPLFNLVEEAVHRRAVAGGVVAGRSSLSTWVQGDGRPEEFDDLDPVRSRPELHVGHADALASDMRAELDLRQAIQLPPDRLRRRGSATGADLSGGKSSVANDQTRLGRRRARREPCSSSALNEKPSSSTENVLEAGEPCRLLMRSRRRSRRAGHSALGDRPRSRPRPSS